MDKAEQRSVSLNISESAEKAGIVTESMSHRRSVDLQRSADSQKLANVRKAADVQNSTDLRKSSGLETSSPVARTSNKSIGLRFSRILSASPASPKTNKFSGGKKSSPVQTEGNGTDNKRVLRDTQRKRYDKKKTSSFYRLDKKKYFIF